MQLIRNTRPQSQLTEPLLTGLRLKVDLVCMSWSPLGEKKKKGKKTHKKTKVREWIIKPSSRVPISEEKAIIISSSVPAAPALIVRIISWCLGLKCLVLMHSVDVALQILLNGSVGGLSPLLNSLYHLNTYCSRCRWGLLTKVPPSCCETTTWWRFAVVDPV